MNLRIENIGLWVHNMHTRMPFRYGIAVLTALPHLIVRLELNVDGRRQCGFAADGLPPKWFTKNPDEPFDHELAAMFAAIEHAADAARELGASSPFDLWQQLHAAQARWARGRDDQPPLLWHFGVSLIERAVIDAFCRAQRMPFAQALRENRLGIDLGAMHGVLKGQSPADLLPAEPRQTVVIRHTVGLSDPLTDAQIPAADRARDRLPQSLQRAIVEYGLTHLKIKLCGKLEQDVPRLREIASLFEGRSDVRFTLDGNEQFYDLDSFRTFWRQLTAEPTVQSFLQGLLFVEQPLHRDRALAPELGDAMAAWPDRPTMIIDESDAELSSLPAALALGYAGTSHKNCKGVFKGIASAALLEHLRRAQPGRRFVHSAEDLANVGPIALLQDLAVLASLGVSHAERNGHHYFKGLAAFDRIVQRQVLAHHGDLYHDHPDGYATLAIQHGRASLATVAAAPFGLAFELDVTQFTPLDQWRYQTLMPAGA